MPESVLNNYLLENIDIGLSGFDLLKESEVNVQNKVLIKKKL